MKLSLTKRDMQRLKEKYSSLKSSSEYLSDYQQYIDGVAAINTHWGSGQEDGSRIWFEAIHKNRDLEQKWEMRFLVKPTLKISFPDELSSVRPGSSLAQVIYAFRISDDKRLIYVKKPKQLVSEKKLEMDFRMRKMLCHVVSSGFKVSSSSLARIMNVDKKTVCNWRKEVETWSESEKNNVLSEMRTHHNYSIKKDILALPARLRGEYSENVEPIFNEEDEF